MNTLKSVGRISLAVALASTLTMAGQETRSQSNKCLIEIGFPGPDAKVGANGDVKGTLKSAPPGTHLWLLAHRKGLGLWWPQAGGEVKVARDGEWVGFITYGEDRDQGREFEVIAVIVDEPTHANLSKWITQAEATGKYPGISLPRVIDTCSVPKLTVTRN